MTKIESTEPSTGTMDDNKLGSLLDNYNNKFEGSGENHKRLEENQDIKNAFNELVENVIRPGMNKFSLLLAKKGFRCSILHETGHQIGFIPMSLNYKKSTYTEFIPPIPPQIKFRIENRKISINESKFDPSGLGCLSWRAPMRYIKSLNHL